jgi:VanZ family protein
LLLLKLPISEEFLRTAAHFLEFTGLAVLVYNAIYQTCSKPKLFLSFAISSAYAVTDEIHQLYVPDRVCSISDWFVDSLGAVAGVAAISLLIYVFSHIKRRRSR